MWQEDMLQLACMYKLNVLNLCCGHSLAHLKAVITACLMQGQCVTNLPRNYCIDVMPYIYKILRIRYHTNELNELQYTILSINIMTVVQFPKHLAILKSLAITTEFYNIHISIAFITSSTRYRKYIQYIYFKVMQTTTVHLYIIFNLIKL